MSRIEFIRCDCGCGETEKQLEVFMCNNGWCTLSYDTDTSNDCLESNKIEYHFKSLKCLKKWIIEI